MPCSYSALSIPFEHWPMGGGIDVKYSLNWQKLLTVQSTGQNQNPVNKKLFVVRRTFRETHWFSHIP